MEPRVQMIITIICSVMASSGFWTYIQMKNSRKDAKTMMLLGLGHDRIVFLGMKYIERGYVTQDEYENLYNYLYEPYDRLGGNGSAKKVMKEVERLPVHN